MNYGRGRAMKNVLVRFVRDQSGTIAVEYGLIALLISVGIVGSLPLIGTILGAMYVAISNAIAAAV
jgi:pilus assembly protein Flp/PilA